MQPFQTHPRTKQRALRRANDALLWKLYQLSAHKVNQYEENLALSMNRACEPIPNQSAFIAGGIIDVYGDGQGEG